MNPERIILQRILKLFNSVDLAEFINRSKDAFKEILEADGLEDWKIVSSQHQGPLILGSTLLLFSLGVGFHVGRVDSSSRDFTYFVRVGDPGVGWMAENPFVIAAIIPLEEWSYRYQETSTSQTQSFNPQSEDPEDSQVVSTRTTDLKDDQEIIQVKPPTQSAASKKDYSGSSALALECCPLSPEAGAEVVEVVKENKGRDPIITRRRKMISGIKMDPEAPKPKQNRVLPSQHLLFSLKDPIQHYIAVDLAIERAENASVPYNCIFEDCGATFTYRSNFTRHLCNNSAHKTFTINPPAPKLAYSDKDRIQFEKSHPNGMIPSPSP